MTREQRKRLRLMVNGASTAWILLVGMLMYLTLPEGAIEHHNSSLVKEKMDAQCNGEFRDKYDCKESIIIQSGRETFWLLSFRFLVVILPPLAGTFWLSSYLRRHPVALAAEEPPTHTEDPGWKNRAQQHVNTTSPEQAAQALHIPKAELPPIVQPRTPGGRTTLNDIAPLDDWTARGHDPGHKPQHPKS